MFRFLCHQPIRFLLAVTFSGFVLISCKSMDTTLVNADALLNIAKSPTGSGLADILNSNNPTATFKDTLNNLKANYAANPQAILQDISTLKKQYKMLRAALQGEVVKEWGSKDVKVPDVVEYVKYTENYQSRAVVNFDTGKVTVETLEQTNYEIALKNAIVTTLLTPDDPSAVDLFSDSDVNLSSSQPPYLYNLVLDQNNRSIKTKSDAEQYAAWLVGNKNKSKLRNTETGMKTTHFVQLNMVSNFPDKQAQKYQPTVAKYAQKFGVNESLIFGVMRTESNFNPFAVSSAPAFGLMQLVPSSGGRDAYKAARGIDEAPTQDFLFNANNNIELGTAYLDVLLTREMGKVSNSVSREYCSIAAYNTGAGNVFKTFGGGRTAAINTINTLAPPAVYDELISNLPYAETRSYVQKVIQFRKNYVSL